MPTRCPQMRALTWKPPPRTPSSTACGAARPAANPGLRDGDLPGSPPRPAADPVRALLAIQARRLELALSGNLQINVVIEESALLTPVGTETILAAQLQHLLAATSTPSVTIQLLALATARAAMSPPFALLDFSDPADAPVVCHGAIAGQVILTTRASRVRAARDTFAALARASLSPASSADLIRNLATPGIPAQLSADCRRSQLVERS